MLNFYRKLRDFLKKFVKLTWFCIVLTENFVKSLWRVVIYSHRNFFSSNHLFSYFFSKIVDFTKLLPKKRKSKFSKLPHFDEHHATSGKIKNLVLPKVFRQINSLVISLLKTLLSRNFCQKYVRRDCSNFDTVHCTVDSVEKWKIYCHPQKISSNQLFSNTFS